MTKDELEKFWRDLPGDTEICLYDPVANAFLELHSARPVVTVLVTKNGPTGHFHRAADGGSKGIRRQIVALDAD